MTDRTGPTNAGPFLVGGAVASRVSVGATAFHVEDAEGDNCNGRLTRWARRARRTATDTATPTASSGFNGGRVVESAFNGCDPCTPRALLEAAGQDLSAAPQSLTDAARRCLPGKCNLPSGFSPCLRVLRASCRCCRRAEDAPAQTQHRADQRGGAYVVLPIRASVSAVRAGAAENQKRILRGVLQIRVPSTAGCSIRPSSALARWC
jgi:hypothetical protein